MIRKCEKIIIDGVLQKLAAVQAMIIGRGDLVLRSEALPILKQCSDKLTLIIPKRIHKGGLEWMHKVLENVDEEE